MTRRTCWTKKGKRKTKDHHEKKKNRRNFLKIFLSRQLRGFGFSAHPDIITGTSRRTTSPTSSSRSQQLRSNREARPSHHRQPAKLALRVIKLTLQKRSLEEKKTANKRKTPLWPITREVSCGRSKRNTDNERMDKHRTMRTSNTPWTIHK
jgi:hypothetical protein